MDGFVIIEKINEDNSTEILYKAKNIITAGLTYSLANMFIDSSDGEIYPYQIGYLQLGSSKNLENGNPYLSPKFYHLSAHFAASAYGPNTNLKLDNHTYMSTSSDFQASPVYNVSSGTFIEIPQGNITQLNNSSLLLSVTLDKNTLVGKTIAEMGLFARNPDNLINSEKSVLVAYKALTPTIVKSNFALKINWFIGHDNNDAYPVEPDYPDVYYGLSSVPLALRRDTQTLDVYKSSIVVPSGNACVIIFHPGSFTTGDKSDIDPAAIALYLNKGLTVVVPNYTLVTETGELGGGALPINFPVFTSGTSDNISLIPSSITPFRLPHGKENAFTDAVRIVQYIKNNHSTYGINKNMVIVGGAAAGGDITCWLTFIPECSATPAQSDDIVEWESTKVLAGLMGGAISDWTRFYTYFIAFGQKVYGLGTLGAAAVPKTLAMSGTIYHPSGTVFNISAVEYTSSVFITSSFNGFSALGTLFNTVLAIPSAIPFYDWAIVPSLKYMMQWREVPLQAKRYWSGLYQASANGATIDGIPWGKTDNSGIFFHAGSHGQSLSAHGFSAVPSWRLYFPTGTVDNQYLDMSSVKSPPGFIAEPGINLTLSTANGLINSSSVGNASAYSSITFTTDPHDILFASAIYSALCLTYPSSQHALSSVFQWYNPSQPANPVNAFGYPTHNEIAQVHNDEINFCLRMATQVNTFYNLFL